MRYFVYSLLVFGILMELHQWILYQSVAPKITLEGYEVASYSSTGAWSAISCWLSLPKSLQQV